MSRWCKHIGATVTLLALMVAVPKIAFADDPANETVAVADVSTPMVDVDASPGEVVADAELDPVVAPAWQTLEPAYSEPTPLPARGKAMYYNPGVMKTVLDSRIKYDQIEVCQRCIGYVAMLRYGDLNRRVWLQFGDQRLEGPFHVIDAAATQHVGQLLARGWVIDVDYQTALRWRMRMPYVTLWEDPPLDLLLAIYARPLHWNATQTPAPAFVGAPQSQDIPMQHLDHGRSAVKQVLELRRRTTRSYIDLTADVPAELYVR